MTRVAGAQGWGAPPDTMPSATIANFVFSLRSLIPSGGNVVGDRRARLDAVGRWP
jgi:hypothetical protein